MFSTRLICLLWLVAPCASLAENCNDVVQAEWLEDGRQMKLLKDYSYVDPPNLKWLAPTGTVVDGASIPRFAWSAIGGPFEGKYRKASVSHDAACEAKTRPWEQVHEMFYNHMLCSGVTKSKAQAMYWAVYWCGPRWNDGGGTTPNWCGTQDALQYLTKVAGFLTQNPVDRLERLQQLTPEFVSQFEIQSGATKTVRPTVPLVDLREPVTNGRDFNVRQKRAFERGDSKVGDKDRLRDRALQERGSLQK